MYSRLIRALVPLLLMGLLCGTAAASGPVSLAGEWKYLPSIDNDDLSAPALNDATWPRMALPSNWFLLGKKQYPTAIDTDPPPHGAYTGWDARSDTRCLDFSGTVWFRRHFSWTSGPSGQHTILRFDMVDYFTDVYVNGRHIGHHEGCFQPFAFDVTRALKSGDNVIAVKVSAPPTPYDTNLVLPVAWPKRQRLLKGIFAYHDTRPGATTDRGQERGTGGIIGDVTLTRSNGVDLVRTEIAPLQVSQKSATLRIDYIFHNWTEQTRPIGLSAAINPHTWHGNTVASFSGHYLCAPGEARVRVFRTLKNPRLWWTWDYGKSDRYCLTTTLPDGEHRSLFGIRSIRHDEHYVWYLNGVRVFVRGTNYISTQWLSQTDRAWYDRDVQLMRDANLNAVRVHAHLERPDFYDVTDEKGIMVWQDFPLQWGYADLPLVHREALRQARDMIGWYFNHPSITVWCMHNESPHAMGENKNTPMARQNLALDNALALLAGRLDASRVVHRDSASGDAHPYDGWYFSKAAGFAVHDYRFVTEYGAEALPDVATLQTMLPASALWPRTRDDWELWCFHDFQRMQTFDIARVPMGDNLQAFVHNSQQYQAALLRFATESLRRKKWRQTTGLYQFMFTDDWPSITWSVLDYYRRPKMGYAALRDAMQPLLPSIEYDIEDPSKPMSLWIVNDLHQGYPGATLHWRRAGKEDVKPVDVAADAALSVAQLGDAMSIADGHETLEVWLTGADGKVLARNRLTADDFLHWKQEDKPWNP